MRRRLPGKRGLSNPNEGQANSGVLGKRFQTERPTRAELHTWFGSGHDYGLGVIFGEVSGGLASRDFDSLESYDAWAATYPTLASMLATVTRRGRHVYCRFAATDVQNFRVRLGKPNGRGAIDIGDGELRVGCCYSVLPPSKLANGFEYRWLIRPTADSLPLLKLADTGFGVCYTEDTDNTGELRGLKTLEGLSEENCGPTAMVTICTVPTTLCPVWRACVAKGRTGNRTDLTHQLRQTASGDFSV